KAMKILKQKMSKEGILQEVKRRRFYEKPSVKRKRKIREARKRRRREMKRRGGGGSGGGTGAPGAREDKGGAGPGAGGGAGERPHGPSIYQTAAWEVDAAGAMDAVAEGAGYFYARYGAPNADACARAVALLEGGERGLCFGSGMAALAALFAAYLGRGATL